MFRKNERHRQAALFSDLDHLTDKARRRLDGSWAGVFRRQFFSRLDESPFAVLYSDEASRPNIPVNVLTSLESLKAAFGWSDEEMHDAFLFDLQVRYAVGYENIGEGDFDLRTVYNFRRRVCDHMRETGENLIEQAFEQISDEQVAAFGLKAGRLRMDSTQIASNIRRMGRLQLLVEVLQRAHRILSEADQTRYAEAFAPYLKGSSGQYVYHLKGEQIEPHLQRIGELMQRLIVELAGEYQSHETYQVLKRVFHEQFILGEDLPEAPASGEGGDGTSGDPAGDGRIETAHAEDGQATGQVGLTANPAIQIRPGQEISPSSLRSPDDPQATYRKKAGRAYEGYVVNLTETCDPGNPFQLIVKVQSAPNVTEDTTFLEESLPQLKARTDVRTIYNDAGFCGPDVDRVLRELKVTQVPTALRGRAPDPSRTTLADCEIRLDAEGQPLELVCPHGCTAHVVPGRKKGRFIARWTDSPCPECHFSKHDAGRRPSTKTCMRFSQVDLDRALRRQRMRAYHLGKKSLRAAVEATVGAVKRPFNNDKVPVRGTIRLGQMMIGSAVMVNIRRIARYRAAKRKEERLAKSRETRITPSSSFFSFLWMHCQRYLLPVKVAQMTPVFEY
jgi:hypothetical protein